MNAPTPVPQLAISNSTRLANTGAQHLDIVADWGYEYLYVGVPQTNPQKSNISIYHCSDLIWLNSLGPSYNIGPDPRKLALGPKHNLVCYTTDAGSFFVGKNGQGTPFTDSLAFAMGMSGDTLYLSNHSNQNLDVFTYNAQAWKFTQQPSIPNIGMLSYIAVDQTTGRVYCLCLGTGQVSCIQPGNPKPVFQIKAWGFLISVAEKLGRVFIGGINNYTPLIRAFNSQTGAEITTPQPFILPQNTRLNAMAMDETSGTLLIGHDNGDPNSPEYYLSVFSATAGGPPLSRLLLKDKGQSFAATSILVSPKGDRIFVSDFNTGTIAQLKPAGPAPLPSLPKTGTIQSRAFPNTFLRMEGPIGKVNCQTVQGAWESFVFESQSDGSVAIMSKAFPGTYLYMLVLQKQNNSSGFGWVTCFKPPLPLPSNCKFLVTAQTESPGLPGSPVYWTIESAAYPGVYLRMDGQRNGPGPFNGGFGLINCQLGHFGWEHFLIQSL